MSHTVHIVLVIQYDHAQNVLTYNELILLNKFILMNQESSPCRKRPRLSSELQAAVPGPPRLGTHL